MNNIDKQTIEARKDEQYKEKVIERFFARQNSIRQLRRRHIALDNWSYAFNIVSVATAAYFVFSITSQYPTGWQIVFSSFLVGLLAMNELAKRFTINEAAEETRIWFVATFFLICISFYASYEGGSRFTVEQAEGPVVEHNFAIDSLNERIAAIDADINRWENQTWRGKIVRDARKGINRLEDAKTALIKQRTELEQRDLHRNDASEQKHTMEIENYGIIFGTVAGLMDALLLICLLIARGAEKEARMLLGLVDNEPVKQKPKKRSTPVVPTVPSLVPTSNTEQKKSETPDMQQIRYADRIGKQLGELKLEIDKLKDSRAHAQAGTPTHIPTQAQVGVSTGTQARTPKRTRTHARTRARESQGQGRRCKNTACKKEFKPKSNKQKFCSKECREEYQKSK